MEKYLTTTDSKSVKYSLGSFQTYGLKYNQLKNYFAADNLYMIFARPEVASSDRISWFTEYAGNAKLYENFDNLEKQMAQDCIRKTFAKMKILSKGIKEREFVENLEALFQIPDNLNCVYLIKRGEASNFTIIQWGCISNKFNASKGKIANQLTKIEFPVTFQLFYPDKALAINEKIDIFYNDVIATFVSDNNGIVHFDKEVLITSPMQAFRLENGEKRYYQEYICDGRTEPYIAEVPRPQPKPRYHSPAPMVVIESEKIPDLPPPPPTNKVLNFKLINGKNQILPQHEIDFNIKGKSLKQTTDNEGKCTFTEQDIHANDSLFAKILYKKRNFNKRIVFLPEKQEYIIKVAHYNWWWLLLLLIPLLLLFVLKKDISFTVQTEGTKKPLKNAIVELSYKQLYLFNFDNYKFFDEQSFVLYDTTNQEGITQFENTKFTLFSFIFKYRQEAKLVVNQSCTEGLQLQRPYTSMHNNFELLLTKGYIQPLNVKVIDKDSLFAIDSAKVILYCIVNNQRQNLITNKLGMVVFPAFTDCCDKLIIKAMKSKYIPDSVVLTMQEAIKDSTKLTIKLKYSEILPPRENCRIFVSGLLISDKYDFQNFSEIYVVDEGSEYVGEGEYSDNTKAFPKAVKYTFDGIAIDKGTRIIIYSSKNFKGKVLLDQTGPAIINNSIFQNVETYKNANTKIFKEPLQSNFPPNVRFWSKSNMQNWSYGSLKVICNQ